MTKKAGVESFLADLLPFFYRRSLVYVDVGAYTGEVFESVLSSGLTIREAHLIEPVPESLKAARERIDPQYPGLNVTYYNVALGASAGYVRMRRARDMSRVLAATAQQSKEEDIPSSTFEVACTTLDELAEGFSERHVSLLKIDVEGFEMEVLNGAKSILQEQRVDLIYIEAGANPDGVQQTYYRSIEDLLAQYGFKLFRIYEQHHEWMADSPLLRRFNLAFMSRKFADANPYRLTKELYSVQSQLVTLKQEAERREQRVSKWKSDFEVMQDERDKLRLRLCALEQSYEGLLQERDALRNSAQRAADRAGKFEAVSRYSEQVLRTVFDSLAQMHRRELRVWKETSAARLESRRVYEELPYRLGAILIRCAKTPAGLVKVPVLLWREYRRWRTRKITGIAELTQENVPLTIACSPDKAVAVPLTRAAQSIVVPKDTNEHTIAVSMLAPSPGARATLELTIKATDGSKHVKAIGEGIGEGEAIGAREGSITRHIELKAGESITLLVLRGSDEDFSFELCRVRGDFGVLMLELQAGDAQILPAERRDSAKGSRRQIGLFPVTELELKLWGGFAAYALPALEEIKLDPYASKSEREDAAWYLTRWYFVEEDYAKALEELQFSKQLKKKPRPRVFLTELLCLLRTGRYEEAHATLESALRISDQMDFYLLKSTIVRHLELARGSSPEQAEAAQLAALNDVLRKRNLAPIEKRRPEEPLSLANIVSHAKSRIEDQTQKLSVIIPAFNAAESIEWVLDSVLNQTWRNLEVIVVDDLSTDNTCEIVERVCASDSRVRLLKKDANSGAYPARNAGVRAATGELIMVHDSDDWSHPQRIEIQIEALIANPHAIGVKSHWVRVSPNIEIVGAWIARGSLYDLNFSSLIFRRELLKTVGLWDEVLVSGDSEFYSRIRALYGENAVFKISKDYLLAFSLTREDSLTRAKATHLRSLFYGLRWNYRDCYLYWHARMQDSSGQLPFDATTGQRVFPIPLGNKPGRRGRERYDLVVISDFAIDDQRLGMALSYLQAGGRCGMKMAVFHWRKYELSSRAPLQPEFYDTCLRFDVDILSPGDSVEADFVICGFPSFLNHRIEPMPSIESKQVIVVVSHMDGDMFGGQEEKYDPLTVRSHLRGIFGTEGIWIPGSQRVQRAMQLDQRYPLTDHEPWLPMLDCSGWTGMPLHWRGAERQVPVIANYRPDRDPSASAIDVREPARLTDADFYAYYPSENDLSSQEVSFELLEAMARGIPVIVPPRFRDTLEAGLMFAEAEAMIEKAVELWSSRDRYLQLAETGRSFVRANCDMSSFADRLQRLSRLEHVDDRKKRAGAS